MVDALGRTMVTGGDRVVRAMPAGPAPTVRTNDGDPAPTTAQTAAAGTLARALATEAPVDTDRVAKIKQAIAEGTYPILPGKIADAMIAERLQWMADDQA